MFTTNAGQSADNAHAQEISFAIVDDRSSSVVFKGAGNYAATRAEAAIRLVEKAFPGLHFSREHDRLLSFLSVKACIDFPVHEETFVAVLSGALTATGARLAKP